MTKIRRWLSAALLAAALLARPLPGKAHGAGIGAIINLDPPAPAPGQAVAVQVELRDVLGNPIPGARVLAAVRQEGQPPGSLAELREGPEGVFSGTLRLPAAGQAVLRVEAHLPDGPWQGELPLATGPGLPPLRNVGLMLAHVEGAPERGPARWWVGVVPLGLLAAGFYLFVRGERGGSR